MKAQKGFSVLMVLMLVLSLILPAMAEEDTIKIGGIAPLTGSAAEYGNAVKQGADLYIDELNAAGGINGKKVEIAWEDDAGNDQQAQSIYYKHLEDCVAILGDVLTQQCRVVASLAVEDGIPMVTASATAFDVTEGKPNVFRSCFIDDFQGIVMANYAADQGYTKVAILYGADDAYSTGLVTNFEEQAAKRGVEIVAKEAAGFHDVDFKAQLTNIKNAAPDAVFLPFYYSEAALILAQAKELGFTTLYLCADGMSNIKSSVADTTLLPQIVYSDHFSFASQDEMVVDFIKNFKDKYGFDPDSSFSATGYDAALVICEGIKAAGSTEWSDIAGAIKGLSVEGVSGTIRFDENNNPIKSAFVMTFDAEGNKVFVTKVDPQ